MIHNIVALALIFGALSFCPLQADELGESAPQKVVAESTDAPQKEDVVSSNVLAEEEEERVSGSEHHAYSLDESLDDDDDDFE